MTTRTGLGWPSETTNGRGEARGLGWPTSTVAVSRETSPARIDIEGDELVLAAPAIAPGEVLDTDESSVDAAAEMVELAPEEPSGDPVVPTPAPSSPVLDTDMESTTAASALPALAPDTPAAPATAARANRLDSAWGEKQITGDAADRALFGADSEAARAAIVTAAAAVAAPKEDAVSRETLLTERAVGDIPVIDLPVAERSVGGAGSLVDAHVERVQARMAPPLRTTPSPAPGAPATETTLPRPAATRIMTVANQKGGVGKTTTTVNVAAALALAGLRVLVIDLDPQGNASTALGVPHHPEVASVYDVLVDGTPLDDVVQECPDIPGLFCAPATIDLAGAEIELVSLVAREMRLGRAVTAYLKTQERAGQRVDYVLVDCPPSLGLLTVNAFVAAEEVFIPIQCEYYALEGLSQLLKNIELIKAHLNPSLHVSTILLTMYDGRTRLSSQVADEVRRHFGTQVISSLVPRSVRISEAPSHGQTVMTYDPSSSGAVSYAAAAAEIAHATPDQGDAR